MQQSSQSLNPWLISYIEQQRNKQSRYEIDKYLIAAGYDPAEIEFVWQSFEPVSPENLAAISQKNHRIILFATFVLIVYEVLLIVTAYFSSFDLIFWLILASLIIFGATFLISARLKDFSLLWLALWNIISISLWILLPSNFTYKPVLIFVFSFGILIILAIRNGKNSKTSKG